MPKLLTYDEYAKVRHDVPYTLTLKGMDSLLYFFGEEHSFDPRNPQWKTLKDYWATFLLRTTGTERIVFTEGGVRPVELSDDEAVLKHGGAGLVTKLAHDEQVLVQSPEPPYALEYEALEKKFSHAEIAYYFFARVVHQWLNHEEPRPPYEEYMQAYLDRDKRESGWTDITYTPKGLADVHRTLFKTEFDAFDSDFLYTQINPVDMTTIGGRVARESSVVRDTYIVERILDRLDHGISVFAEYGCSHVVIQEPYLRSVLNEVQ